MNTIRVNGNRALSATGQQYRLVTSTRIDDPDLLPP